MRHDIVQHMPRGIPAPVELQPVIALWWRFAPSTWVPVSELRRLAVTYGAGVVEQAVAQCGERDELTLRRLQPFLDRIASARQRQDARGRK